jgi:type I restriction enzyme M protein
LEELVLASSGEDEFDEVFKLIIAKLRDELSGAPGRFAAQGTAAETFAIVCALLADADRNWNLLDGDVTPRLSPDHLQVCVSALENHQIAGTGLEVMDSFFEFLVGRAAKGAKGQYFTPRHVIDLCIEMLQPAIHETVLDPCCGSGGFLIHALERARRGSPLASPDDLADYCAAKLWGFDIDSRAVRVAKALTIVATGGSGKFRRLNSLVNSASSGAEAQARTIEEACGANGGFDVILTNPPFAGEVRERALLDSYDLSRDQDAVERDLLFVERCVGLLRPGGRMAIVLPDNKFAGESHAPLRRWLMSRARILAVVGLGRNTFLPHTHQKAGILFLQKHASRECSPKEYNIFFAVSERDGKNTKGQPVARPDAPPEAPAWERIDHDFEEIVSVFRDFCAAERISWRV